MKKERLYTEKEISAILKRAGELHSESGLDETYGLSLEELKQIADEVGLEPELLAQAAAELDTKTTRRVRRFSLGIKSTYHLERVVKGEFGDDDWEEITSEIERTFGVIGSSGTVGVAFQWTSSLNQKQVQVTLIPGKGQTKVRIDGDFSNIPVAYPLFQLSWPFIAFVFTILIAMDGGISGSASFGIGIGIAWPIFLALHYGWDAYVESKESTAEGLLERLDALISARSSTQTPELESYAAAERIELPEDELEEPDDEAIRLRRRASE